MGYYEELNDQFWKFQKINFQNATEYFDKERSMSVRPPVFKPQYEWLNIIFHPNSAVKQIKELLEMIPINNRHRWFGSFKSSQALGLSVLGNLKIIDPNMNYLYEIKDDEYDESLISNIQPFSPQLKFEHEMDYLNEKRKTNIDALLSGEDYKISIECKFTEEEIGTCSRTKLRPDNSNYITDYCNSSYSIQQNRKERCSLTEIGVRYWEYIPEIFDWKNDMDYHQCPLNESYQLVRNILTACIYPDGSIAEQNGHALLIYDNRNPAFQENGKGYNAYLMTKSGLKNKKLLRKCSWQKIIKHLNLQKDLDWLTTELKIKYGF